MSSDPTQPVPEWWQQPQGPKKDRGYQGNQDSQGTQGTQDFPANQGNQDYQATQQYPTNQGFPAGQGSPSGQGYPSDQGFPAGQGYPSGQGFPPGQGYQQDQGYPGNQGAQRYPANQGFPVAQGYQGPPARMRRRRRRWPLITLIVIIVVLVVGDRAANAYTEDQMASQMQKSLALSGKPHVTIQGFPFLTQLASRDFRTVDINASNETAGPGGQLEIASLTATLHGMHIHGLKSATVDQFNAAALVTFTALAHAGGVPEGITLAAAGPDKIKANFDLGPINESATAKITKTGRGRINIQVTDAGGITSDILGNLNFNVNIPKLPAGVAIQSISVTQQGLRITVNGQNTTLSQ
jgi:LmeA-like phospholipid-binding